MKSLTFKIKQRRRKALPAVAGALPADSPPGVQTAPSGPGVTSPRPSREPSRPSRTEAADRSGFAGLARLVPYSPWCTSAVPFAFSCHLVHLVAAQPPAGEALTAPLGRVPSGSVCVGRLLAARELPCRPTWAPETLPDLGFRPSRAQVLPEENAPSHGGRTGKRRDSTRWVSLTPRFWSQVLIGPWGRVSHQHLAHLEPQPPRPCLGSSPWPQWPPRLSWPPPPSPVTCSHRCHSCHFSGRSK